jgi:hypothetical protein
VLAHISDPHFDGSRRSLERAARVMTTLRPPWPSTSSTTIGD